MNSNNQAKKINFIHPQQPHPDVDSSTVAGCCTDAEELGCATGVGGLLNVGGGTGCGKGEVDLTGGTGLGADFGCEDFGMGLG